MKRFPIPAILSSITQSEESNAIADYLKGYTPITGETMATASNVMSPVTSLMGNIAGCIMVFASAGIFLVTAFDLAYIGLPFCRSWLNPALRGIPELGLRRRWVSDEAIAATASLSADSQQNPINNTGMGIMNMPSQQYPNQYMQPQPATQPAQPMKSVIFEYFKKRSFFMIVFTVCSAVLMSSMLTDCGINIAMLIDRMSSSIISKVSMRLP